MMALSLHRQRTNQMSGELQALELHEELEKITKLLKAICEELAIDPDQVLDDDG